MILTARLPVGKDRSETLATARKVKAGTAMRIGNLEGIITVMNLGVEKAHARGMTHTVGGTGGMIRTVEMIFTAGITGAMTHTVVMVLTVGMTRIVGMIRIVKTAAMIVVRTMIARIGPVGLTAATEGKAATNGIAAIGRKAVVVIGATTGIIEMTKITTTRMGPIGKGHTNLEGAMTMTEWVITAKMRNGMQNSTCCSMHLGLKIPPSKSEKSISRNPGKSGAIDGNLTGEVVRETVPSNHLGAAGPDNFTTRPKWPET